MCLLDLSDELVLDPVKGRELDVGSDTLYEHFFRAGVYRLDYFLWLELDDKED